MKTILVTYILILFISAPTHACICDEIRDHKEYIIESFNGAKVVFTGDIIKKENQFYIIVKEVFKGDLMPRQSLIAGTKGTSCDAVFLSEGSLLFYGWIEQETFYSKLCSPTRSLEYPTLYPPPPPPPPGYGINDSIQIFQDFGEKIKSWERQEAERLNYELKLLGELKEKNPRPNNG